MGRKIKLSTKQGQEISSALHKAREEKIEHDRQKYVIPMGLETREKIEEILREELTSNGQKTI